MTKQDTFNKLTEQSRKYRESVKEGFRTLSPAERQNLAATLIVAGSNPTVIRPENMTRVFGLAHIGAMDILFELEQEAEQTAKAV
ncbi:MAG: hypothetical protein E6R03_07575 [Hyphomicrobiaceae bacterium]|nr:MAG: hypothetical protein E6R03_07575 [Hyphomicrobiaceae bacterium]